MTMTITINGIRFGVDIEPDNDKGAPWFEEDGHGPVREVRVHQGDRVTKLAGELVMHRDRYGVRLYDFAAACKLARRDGWGPHVDGETRRQTAARCAMKDFDRLRAWCNDEWSWVGVEVALSTGGDSAITRALWGIESDEVDYQKDLAHELAGEIIDELEETFGAGSMTGIYGYIQFWVMGYPADEAQHEENKEPVMRTKFERSYDENGLPQLAPPRQFFGSEHGMEQMIEKGRELCLKYRMLGFTLHSNDGVQLRELELTNIWAEGLRTND